MLRQAAPDYADWHEARTLTAGAEIALRDQLDDPRKPVPIALRDRLANVLADRSPERRARIIEAVEDYRSDLDALGVSDADVQARLSTGGLMVSLVLQVVAAVLVLPFAVVGAVINAVPALIVKAVGLVRMAPSMQATVKPAVAIVASASRGAWWCGPDSSGSVSAERRRPSSCCRCIWPRSSCWPSGWP